ncbi:MAG: hypothetical protein EHM12_08285 [Dehalococcoidia bacterium]|jgi:hypothetical protein|nr:MAG: hypothetical protein EHM12_08285 [Dehalococcoidia bacterium]
MKVYSLYHENKFVAAFRNRDEAVSYGKIHYSDCPWDCNITEEYLHKSPISYIPPSNPLTNPGPSIPWVQPPVTTIPPAKYPSTYPGVYCDGRVKVTWNVTGDGV